MNVNEISELTRRDILDFILDDEEKPINGRLELIQFLERTWDLKSILSSNYDYDSLKSAIWQHMINNDDWSYYDLLKDQLHLLTCADDVFLKFLANCLNPYVFIKVMLNLHLRRLINFLNRMDTSYCRLGLSPAGQSMKDTRKQRKESLIKDVYALII